MPARHFEWTLLALRGNRWRIAAFAMFCAASFVAASPEPDIGVSPAVDLDVDSSLLEIAVEGEQRSIRPDAFPSRTEPERDGDSDDDEDDKDSDDDEEDDDEDSNVGNDSRDDVHYITEKLGLDKIGIDFDGTWIIDQSTCFSGGLLPGQWSGQNLLYLDAFLDLEKILGWNNALVGIGYLHHRGSSAYPLTGDVQDFNGLDVGLTKSRSELFELWIKQTLFDDRVSIRFGKMNANNDFCYNNPSVLFGHGAHGYPTTMYFGFPSYPDSATGVDIFVYSEEERFYAGFGFYDGRFGSDATIPTGERGPQFNGRYFYIGEVGVNFELFDETRDGRLGVGYWGQTGPQQQFSGNMQNGEQGFYMVYDQTFWLEDPDDVNQGITGFLQFGTGDQRVNLFELYIGGGLNWQGFIRGRDQDSLGLGFAFSDLTDEPGAIQNEFPQFTSGNLPASEIAYQARYHLQVTRLFSFQTFITYIQDPGEDSNIPNAWAGSFRFLFDF